MNLDNPIARVWYDFINRNTSEEVTVTFAKEITGNDAPRPNGTYVTIDFMSGPDTLGQDELRKKTSDKYYNLIGQRQYIVEIQAFRYNSQYICERLQTLLDNPNIYQEFKESTACIAIVDRGTVNDLSELLETGYEERHAFEVTFNTVVNVITNLESIDRIKISGEIENLNTDIDTERS